MLELGLISWQFLKAAFQVLTEIYSAFSNVQGQENLPVTVARGAFEEILCFFSNASLFSRCRLSSCM